jgi:stage V sporulation protein B
LTAFASLAREQARASVQWVYLSSAGFFLSGGVFYLYIARILPYAELGSVVILAAIAAVMSVGFGFGLGYGFQHFLSYNLGRSRPSAIRWLTRRAWTTAGLLFAVSSGVTAVLSGSLSTLFFHSQAYAPTIRILAIFVGLLTANSILQSVLLGYQRFVVYSAVTAAGYLATYGVPIVLLAISPSVESITVGWTVGSALGCAFLLAAILRYGLEEEARLSQTRRDEAVPRLFRTLVLYSPPMFLAALVATGTTYIDRLVLASLTNLANVGVYNYALLVAGGSLIVVSPFGTITLPKFSELFGRDDRDGIRKLTRISTTLIVLVYVPVALGIAALAPFLLRVLVGNGYVGAGLSLQLILGISAAFVPYAILTSLAAGIRRTPLLLVSTALALGSNVALCLALVPRWGMVGAALGNSSVYWVSFLVLSARLRSTALLGFELGSICRIWLAAAGMFLIVWTPLFLLSYPPVLVPVLVLIGVGAFLSLLRVSRAINAETADALHHVMPRWLWFARPLIAWTRRTDAVDHPGMALSLENR